MEYIAFFGAIKHNQTDYVLQILQEYDIGSWLLGLEVTKDAHKETNGEHIHFLVQMNDKDYHKFSKRIFIDKYKLRGKALKDKPRQYGRVKKIEDLSRMAAYTIKDKNIRTNMSEEQLEQYRAIAFQNQEKDDFRQDLMKYIEDQYNISQKQDDYGVAIPWTFSQIGCCIIKYYRSLKDHLPVNKAQIESHIRYYMMYHNRIYTDLHIFKIMFPFGEN